jgi:hypothetical protein
MNAPLNLSDTIIPKSDQLNADDLHAGPITITVLKVSRGESADQPVSIHYEGGEGRPYKPCKTMRKVLIHAWGNDGHQWAGKSMTLFCDPDVQFGGVKIGGIRISHLSDIDGDFSLPVNTTRGKKARYPVKRLNNAPRKPAQQQQTGATDSADLTPVTAEQVENMTNALEERGVEPKALCDAAAAFLGLPIARLDQIPASFYGKACGWIAKQNPAPSSEFE